MLSYMHSLNTAKKPEGPGLEFTGKPEGTTKKAPREQLCGALVQITRSSRNAAICFAS